LKTWFRKFKKLKLKIKISKTKLQANALPSIVTDDRSHKITFAFAQHDIHTFMHARA